MKYQLYPEPPSKWRTVVLPVVIGLILGAAVYLFFMNIFLIAWWLAGIIDKVIMRS